ncbi:hypothetical protein QR680_017312 [Steinernema hermaphroditum]|uniref:N-acetyltransferase domain-containing protein n=1 Tax=Steinernema hermaphroditum TaxID=289476 RepID=A0AA39LP19_9BILA|nr:hypothetical protein QR680_017312 [Steinernema hermaphroditum]
MRSIHAARRRKGAPALRSRGSGDVAQFHQSGAFEDAERFEVVLQECTERGAHESFLGSTHIAAYVGSQVVGVCRVRNAAPFVKLERVAILPEYRKCGYGEQIVQEALNVAQNDPIYADLIVGVHAQSYLINWYTRFGFKPFGDEFSECGIKHKIMIIWPNFTAPLQYERLRINKPSIYGFPGQKTKSSHDIDHAKNIDKVRDFLYQMERPFVLPNLILQSRDITKYFTGNLLYIIFQQLTEKFFKDDYCLTESTTKLYNTLIDKLTCRINAHYSTVDDRWRYFYTCAKTIKMIHLYKNGNYKEALAACDDALMKGGDLDDQSLSRCAHDIQINLLPAAPKIDFSKLGSRRPVRALRGISSATVDECIEPSFDTFSRHVVHGTPVVIRRAVENMPATQKWSFEYLHHILSHRHVPIEYGSYTEDSFSQKVRTFHDFLVELVESGNKNSKVKAGYLAQHRLFDQVPVLENDVPTPDYCFCHPQNEAHVEKHIFLGKGGSASPMHHDPRDNFFCQIQGRKFFRLISPKFKENLYLFDDPMAKNSSQIDLEDPDLEEFPLFKNVIIEDVLLQPGDALFIPKGYFHYVASIDPSISVSMWFGSSKYDGSKNTLVVENSTTETPAEEMEVHKAKKKKRESYV